MKSRLWLGLFLLSPSAVSHAATSAFYVAPGVNGSEWVSAPTLAEAPAYEFVALGGGTSYIIGDVAAGPELPGYTAEGEVELMGPNGAKVQPGMYEAGRVTFQDPGTVGFSFYFDDRGYNTSVSLINVLEIAYDSNGRISQLAVDFTQYEETDTSSVGQDLSGFRSDVGSFRFNSDIPLTVPEPSASLVFVAGIAGAVFKRRRQS